MKKIVLFSVKGSKKYLVTAIALSIDLRKNGYKTILLSENCDDSFVKNNFDEIYSISSLSNFLKFLLLLPYILYLNIKLTIKCDELISYSGKISIFPKFFFFIFRKNFFSMIPTNKLTMIDKFLLYNSQAIFYIYSDLNLKKQTKNAFLTGMYLPNNYKFNYRKYDSSNFLITIFLNKKETYEYLYRLDLLLSEAIKKKLVINVNYEFDAKNFNFKNICFIQNTALFNLISESHLIVAKSDAMLVSKVSALGRCLFLLNDQNSNASNYSKIIKGSYNELAEMISNLLMYKNFYYENCKNSSLIFYNDSKIILKHI